MKITNDYVLLSRYVKYSNICRQDKDWDISRSMLSEPVKFLESLFGYDKENISENTIRLIQPFIDNDAFQPAAIAKVRGKAIQSAAITQVSQ